MLIISSALLDLLLPETVGKTLPKDIDEMLGNDIDSDMYSPLKLDESDSDVELDKMGENSADAK